MKQLTLLFLLFNISLLAQESTPNNGIKLYTNFEVNSNYFRLNGVDMLYLTPAFLVNTTSGNFWEFEMSHLNYRDYNEEDISGPNIKEFELFLRAEYDFRFRKEKDGKLKPILGLSATPFYQMHSSSPRLATVARQSERKLGIYLSVIPRLEYYLNERVLIDFNIPIGFISGAYNREFLEDPTLPFDSRSKTIYDMDILNSLGLRLGVGYIL